MTDGYGGITQTEDAEFFVNGVEGDLSGANTARLLVIEGGTGGTGVFPLSDLASDYRAKNIPGFTREQRMMKRDQTTLLQGEVRSSGGEVVALPPGPLHQRRWMLWIIWAASMKGTE